jgi:glucose-6-phosphate isomerase
MSVGIETNIGDYQGMVDYALAALDEQGFSQRLWEKDPGLWRQGVEIDKAIKNRLGWLEVVNTMIERSAEIVDFAEKVKSDGFTHAVLMGMGGSSLSPEVSAITFGAKSGYPSVIVLDSTVPSTVADVEKRIDLEKTLFIVSTKSGTTVETLSAYKYFFEKLQAKKGSTAGSSFVAITDPGSKLQSEAAEKDFRHAFINFEDIGGRYSALSYFGLVPAAIMGVDVKLLLDRAAQMVESTASSVLPSESPSIILGAVLGELALKGRNKLTLVTSPKIRSFGLWVEQLVAESTGKNGAGIVPVDGELLAAPADYGDDRLFVHLRVASDETEEVTAKLKALEKTGQPVVTIDLDDEYDLGGEYFRWEIATGVASALLGVNSFDEPNVKESKDNTNRLLDAFKANGSLPEVSPVLEEDGIKLYCDDQTKTILNRTMEVGGVSEKSILTYISAHLDQFQPGNYFGLMAFIRQTPEIDELFRSIRSTLVPAYSAATTLGFGPRFLHSTGQLHKGGPNSGIFIQFTADDNIDVAIPAEPYTFSILKQAQSMGDGISLRSKGRPMIRLHLGKDPVAGLEKVLGLIREAVKEQP